MFYLNRTLRTERDGVVGVCVRMRGFNFTSHCIDDGSQTRTTTSTSRFNRLQQTANGEERCDTALAPTCTHTHCFSLDVQEVSPLQVRQNFFVCLAYLHPLKKLSNQGLKACTANGICLGFSTAVYKAAGADRNPLAGIWPDGP